MQIFGEEVNGKWVASVVTVVLVVFGAIFFRSCCVTFVDSYELGYRYDRRSGVLSLVGRTGYVVYLPIAVDVHTIDLRPTQVCINANTKVLNCKLVKFNPDGLELFLKWHGRNDYETAHSMGSSAEPTDFNRILMSYAYDGHRGGYPFLTIMRELKPEESDGSQPMTSP